MSNSMHMHGECDPILHSDFPHQLGYVRLDRALPDAHRDADFFVRSPSTSIFRTSVSRSVKANFWSAGKICRGALPMRSMNIDSTRRGTQAEPRLTIRVACAKSAGDAAHCDAVFARNCLLVPPDSCSLRRSCSLSAIVSRCSNRCRVLSP